MSMKLWYPQGYTFFSTFSGRKLRSNAVSSQIHFLYFKMGILWIQHYRTRSFAFSFCCIHPINAYLSDAQHVATSKPEHFDAMLSFQVKSVIPMMSMKSNFFVIFPPMTYDYYSLYDFLLLGKIGDMLLVVFVNVMTKFDEGIVRMFPPGKIRRYLY